MEMGLLEIILRQIHSFLALGILLAGSGLICISETAIFSLSHYDRGRIRLISARIGGLVDYILDRPESLLLSLMVANMAVNSLIFTISSLLVYQFIRAGHPVFAGGIGVGTLLVLVLFGEILAKGTIYYLRVPASLVVAVPVYGLVRTLAIPTNLVQKILIAPIVRLVIGPEREAAISKSELLALFNIAGEERYLEPGQVDLLRKVAELRDLRVRQVMIPRVDMPACEIHQPPEEIKKLIRETHRARIAVFVYQIDYVVGILRSRRLLVEEPRRAKDILERVRFVPEHQRVDQLLRFFHRERTDVAMVVDEYGGLMGMVTLEELIERTIGELSAEFPDPDAPKILPVRPDEHLIDGHYPLLGFCRQFQLPVPPVEVDTLAGLVMHLAGHLPEPNETLNYNGLDLIVKEVDAKRIVKVLVRDRRRGRD